MPRRSVPRLVPLVLSLACATEPAGSREAELVFSAIQHDFGDVMLGISSAPLQLILVNRGPVRTGDVFVGVDGVHAHDFAISRDLCTGTQLRSGGTCVVEVHLRPTSTGSKHAVVRATAAPELSAATTLSGDGSDIGLQFSSDSVAFGDNVAGTMRALTISLKNWGALTTGPLVTALGGTGAGAFSIARDGCRGQLLPIAARCDFEIRYGAGSPGESEATLTVHGAPGGNATAQLRGRSGTPTELGASPATGNFGGQRIRAPGRDLTFTIANQGIGSPGVLQALLGGNDVNDYTIRSNGCDGRILRSGESCDVVVRFEPTADGERSATLTVSDALGSSVIVSLAGTGGSVVLEVDRVRIDFGGRMVGLGEVEDTLEVRNSGTIMSGIVTAVCQFNICNPPFRVLGFCGSLLPGGRCVLRVRFLPLIAGMREGQFLIGDGGSSVPVRVAGLGTGLSVVASAAIPSTTPGTPGSATTLVVTNTADRPTGPIATLLTSSDFEIPANGCRDVALLPAQNCSITLRAAARSTTGILGGSLRFEAHPGGTIATQLTGAVR